MKDIRLYPQGALPPSTPFQRYIMNNKYMNIKTYTLMMKYFNNVMQEAVAAKNALTDEFMNSNRDTPYTQTLLDLAKVDKIQAIKFHRAARKLDLRRAKAEVDALLEQE